MDGHVLAHLAAGAQFGAGGFATVFQVLRRHADGAVRVQHGVGADAGVAVDHDMRNQPRAVLDLDIRADGAEWADLDIHAQASSGVDHGQLVNAHARLDRGGVTHGGGDRGGVAGKSIHQTVFRGPKV